ncbi:MAG: ABC transporter ATP-binding protein [Methylobacter sp.]
MFVEENNGFAIKFSEVSKVYHTYSTPQHRLLEILYGGRKRYARETIALNNVSFTLPKGGRLGIVGENGSGKSTLLKVLAGVLTPSSGTVQVNGRLSALLELGAGFNPDLTGNENIRQYCMLHGMSHDEIENALPEIIQFSELKEFMDNPIKTYSSGMAMRLGFSCAVYVKPDILIVDEALSVGDTYFQNKCLHKIKSMLDQGTAFIYVTHAADAIRSLCKTGLWLEKGSIKMFGDSTDVGASYQSAMFNRLVQAGQVPSQLDDSSDIHTDMLPSAAPLKGSDSKIQTFASRVDSLRTGSGEIRIIDISLINSSGVEVDSFEFNETIRIRAYIKAKAPVRNRCALSVGITDSYGRQIYHFNSTLKNIYASDVPESGEAVIEFEFDSRLCPGEFGIVAGIGALEEHPAINDLSVPSSVIDYCAGGARFSVKPPVNKTGKYDLWGLVHCDYKASITTSL